MSKDVTRDQVQAALRVMAGRVREARDDYRRERAVCQERGLFKAGDSASLPVSFAERAACWGMAHRMLRIAVSQLLFSGKNNASVHRYVNDLINGECWPTEN